MKRLFIYKGLELEANINGYATYELLCCAQHNNSSRTYRLPKAKLAEAERIENKMQTLLSGNDELDVCILLKMLNEKLR